MEAFPRRPGQEPVAHNPLGQCDGIFFCLWFSCWFGILRVINSLAILETTDAISPVEIEEMLSTSSRSTVSLPVPPPSPHTHISASIKRALLHDQQHYRVQPNSSTHATAQCWKVFFSPSKMNENSINDFTIIPGFISYNGCFETNKYMDSSTGNLNSHHCSRSLPSDQNTLSSFVQSPSRTNGKLVARKKREMKKLCIRWIACSMQPFQIVSDPGVKQIIQASINLGLY